MKSKEKHPKDWTLEERVSALIETGAMVPEECSAWCRKNGFFSHRLEQWKKDVIFGISNISGKQMLEKSINIKRKFQYDT